ncbi:MAG: RnfABCDGE type electron transport complex subunit G [Bacteroidales bacterium]|nr:RnfABCDGE type electron transport complex subunit G [Bacteroidales bacterium]
MAKLESSFKNMVLVLCGISILAAGALGVVYDLTQEPIKAAELANQEAAIKAVTSGFNNAPVKEKYVLISPEGDSLMCFPAKQDGKLTGVAIESFSNKGFHGEIKVMVGLDPSGKILNYSVVKHTETPGLGSKMSDWFKTDKNRQSILGLDPGKNKVWVSKDGGEVDAITAATITSRAFLDAIDRAYRSYMASLNVELDARTGASAQKAEEAPEPVSQKTWQPAEAVSKQEMQIVEPVLKKEMQTAKPALKKEVQIQQSVKNVEPSPAPKQAVLKSETKDTTQPKVAQKDDHEVDAQTSASADFSNEKEEVPAHEKK